MKTIQLKQSMTRRACTAAVVLLGIAAPVAAHAQKRPDDPSPVTLPGHHYDLPATLIKAAQIEEHKKKMLAADRDDVPMNMVKAGGAGDKHQVGVSLVTRVVANKNGAYAVHDDVAEVYYVIEGKGHMKIGGKITDWKRRPISAGNGQGSTGTVSEGAQDFTIEKGDVLIIPAGTPHKWVSSDKFTSYVAIRVDPDGVAPVMELGTAKFKHD